MVGLVEGEPFLRQTIGTCIDWDQILTRTIVQLTVQIIQDDGSVLSCALHVIVAALMNAGIPLLQLPVATTIGIRYTYNQTTSSKGGRKMDMRLDPTLEEEDDDEE